METDTANTGLKEARLIEANFIYYVLDGIAVKI